MSLNNENTGDEESLLPSSPPSLKTESSGLWTTSTSTTTETATITPIKKEEAKVETVTITFSDRPGKITLPLLTPVLGPKAIDVRKLYSQAGVFTYDPGFISTCSCSSEITFIDGPKGILAYRGYQIADLCDNSNYCEVSFLLLYGQLPSHEQAISHQADLRKHRMVHQKLISFYNGFKSDAHPMAMMVGVVGALSAFFNDNLDITQTEQRCLAAYRIIAKMPTIAAIAYKMSIGEPIVYPRDDLNYAENFLYMLFKKPTGEYIINPVLAKAMETFIILHCDHEQNASTSTVRIAGSSRANPYACIASGISALWGPLHGGANEAVLRMLAEIKTADRIPQFLAKAKDKKDPFRLMGFGHRVYKNYDPRATIMKKMCTAVLAETKPKNNTERDPLLDLAMKLEEAALQDEYFIKRKLFPNVDFYSGIVLKAMGIPLDMFTVFFAVARTTGWISQWKEMLEDPFQRIGRPRQLYMGAKVASTSTVKQFRDQKANKNGEVLSES